MSAEGGIPFERLRDASTAERLVSLSTSYSSDEYEVERETNLSAVLASLSLSKGIPPSADIESSIDSLGDQMYELCYNKACIEVGREDYQKALELLTKAEEECISSMREDDATEEEIEAEAGIIRAQQ